MYTKRIYSPGALLLWTRHDLLRFVLIATMPVVVYSLLGQRWLQLPWLPIALVGTAVAFILAFQNNASYDRTWEARKIWGGIVNASRSWAFMARDFVTNEFAGESASDEELAAIRRRLVIRQAAWMTALRHGLRQARPWESLQRCLRTDREWTERIAVQERRVGLSEELEGYLSEALQAEALARANPAAQVLSIQSRELGELKARGLIDNFRHIELERMLVTFCELQGKCERIKNFPYPRQYATLNAVFVWIFICLLPLGLVAEFDSVGRELEAAYPTVGRFFVWMSVPLSVTVMWVFHTIGRIGQVSENPFEGSPNDVPITTMARAIEIDMREILGEDAASIPTPVEARFAVQT